MSIATLKKKTQTQYNNMSVNSKHGFSLNGTRRSQGYVGQTSLSRSINRTLFRGGVARGFGGCCGTFPQNILSSSDVTTLNDPEIVKPSVINTLGMIEERYQYLLNHQTVKPDANQYFNTQHQHTTSLGKKTILCADKLRATDKQLNANACKKCYNYNTFFRKKIQTYTKPKSNYIPISQGEYLIKVDEKCKKNLDKPYIPVKYNRGVLPGPAAHYY